MLIVQVCDFGNDGDAEYRMHAPSRQLGKFAVEPGHHRANTIPILNPSCDAHEPAVPVTTIDCHFSHRCLPALTELADVLVVQFINDWELLSICQRRRDAGLLTVFEANDYFFDLQPWSPIASAWQDRTVQELYSQLLTTADGVQTSTEDLARRWRERGAKVVAVFPNHLVELDPLPDVTDRPLTVGWGGSPGHFADWYQLAPLLTRWLTDHPEVHLSVMSHELAHSFVQLAPERYHFTKFGSLSDYFRFLRSLDIGLAPLVTTDYNRGRSDVKFLEYARQGVVGIYSDLEPYRSSVVHGATGMMCRSPAEMIDHLELLRANSDLRGRLRQRAYDYVQDNRRLRNNVGERIDWYRSLLKRQLAASRPLPLVVRQSATARDDNYWQLRPQAPELALLETMKQHDKLEATKCLSQQLQREPDYLAALNRQGQLLNDLRDHDQALIHLERARALEPHNPRTLSEIGRAWFCLNDAVRAREALEEAIQTDSKYLPAWQYLLRLLSLTKTIDGPVWARRAEERFPMCYPLTFLAAQVYPPAESIAAMQRVIDRLATTIIPRERTTILGAVRQALKFAVQSASHLPELVPLLRRAYEIFPESAWLANELGSAIYRAGEYSEAHAYHAEAMRIRQQAMIFREEFPNQDAAPWQWQLAEHLHGHVPSDRAT